MTDLLTTILDHKRQEVAQRKQHTSLATLQAQINNAPAPRGFVSAIRQKLAERQPAIIAEIKKASPSKGILREIFEPVKIAQDYAQAGAACLSVLTDEKFFQGAIDYIPQIRANCVLPVLRKDFIVDAYQIYESRVIAADAILLIAAALTDEQLQKFADLAQQLVLDVLIEVHDASELQRALKLSTPLLGINNRNLQTFTTQLSTTLSLLPHIPADKIVVTESGINTAADMQHLYRSGVHVFLIGEAFMRAENPGEQLRAFLRSVAS